jgi:hypothetical protein
MTRIVLVGDGAGWHRSETLKAPANIYLLKLPRYAPELTPIEHIWDELREKFFHNRVFQRLHALEEHLALARKPWKATQHDRHPRVLAMDYYCIFNFTCVLEVEFGSRISGRLVSIEVSISIQLSRERP